MGYKNVCFDCRKAFNQGSNLSNIRESKCPECGILMKQITHRFRPPKHNDIKKWDVAKFLMKNGFLYQHVWEKIFRNEKGEIYATANYAKYPESMKEAKEFVELNKEQAIKE
ncbi:MAG: hypothetical protein P8Q53_04045 [Flavobacteriaceae bacterium]|nr:hypothetical protein [Flavobacteriaceae bacterium]